MRTLIIQLPRKTTQTVQGLWFSKHNEITPSGSLTFESGDGKISIDDAGTGNINTLTTEDPASSKMWRQLFTRSELDGAMIVLDYIDQTSPPEWDPLKVVVQTYGIGLNVVADGGNSTTVSKTDLASSTDDFYNGMWARAIGGANAGLRRKISDYVGSTKTITWAVAWPTAPATNEEFVIE